MVAMCRVRETTKMTLRERRVVSLYDTAEEENDGPETTTKDDGGSPLTLPESYD